MFRNALNDLAAWQASPRRKPLILQGARQVGKTWLALEFGRTHFQHVAHVVFLDNAPMKAVFEGSLAPDRLLTAIAAETGVPVGDENTLVVFDEIQECPRAITALKLFCEQAPEVPVIAAGSLLGVALHEGVSFPVGKVDHLNLHPMTFEEFLIAVGEGGLVDLLKQRDTSLIDAFAERYTDLLKQYYFVGGMPEAVAEFAQSKDFAHVRAIQERLIFGYEHDFSKHAGGLLGERIREVWESAPSQLARENKKFVYSAVRPGGRARNFEEAIRRLVDAGLLTKVSRVSKPGLPLASYKDLTAFKLYLLDVGLLGAIIRLDAKTIIDGNRLFEEFKGALTEQFVCQQLIATGKTHPFYWTASNSSAEIDFIYDYENEVVPVEVKAGTNVKSRSLASFVEKYGITRSVRLSLAGYRKQDWLENVPLYAIGMLPDPPSIER